VIGSAVCGPIVADAATRVVLGRYFVLAGSTRFAIEFIRVNARLLGPLTLAHLISLALVTIGAAMIFRQRILTAGEETPGAGIMRGTR
jgi:prolipoprotein diacylglyceryltransferase